VSDVSVFVDVCACMNTRIRDAFPGSELKSHVDARYTCIDSHASESHLGGYSSTGYNRAQSLLPLTFSSTRFSPIYLSLRIRVVVSSYLPTIVRRLSQSMARARERIFLNFRAFPCCLPNLPRVSSEYRQSAHADRYISPSLLFFFSPVDCRTTGICIEMKTFPFDRYLHGRGLLSSLLPSNGRSLYHEFVHIRAIHRPLAQMPSSCPW